MATYNGEEYIEDQISSILQQLSADDELVISDDLSNDNTVKIIRAFDDERIKLFINLNKISISSNFENAILHSKGDFIFLTDQDDVWMEDKIEKMMKYLKEYELVVSDAIVTDENLNIICESIFKLLNSKRGVLKNIIKNSFYGSCMAFNKCILERAVPIPLNNEIGHDLWLGLVSEIYYKVYFLDIPLIYYRRHKNAVTEGIEKSKRRLLEKIIGRAVILKELLKLVFKNIGT
jgi:glycosyltransferase involved in cell wall biosynthesis